jgi:hypothetical protein
MNKQGILLLKTLLFKLFKDKHVYDNNITSNTVDEVRKFILFYFLVTYLINFM